jgi:drug/metabolite transporter (DMT)-like permease
MSPAPDLLQSRAVSRIVVAYLTCALVWGTTWYAVRASTGAAGFPTLESVALRFTIAAVVLAPIVWLARVGPWPRGRRTWMWMVVAGVLDAGSYALVYYGEQRIPGGLAAVLFSTQPLIVAAMLTASGMETVRKADIVGALVALAGVVLIGAERWDVSTSQAIGLLMMLGAVACSASYSFVLKRSGDGLHPLATTLIFLAVTAVVLDLAVLVRGPEAIPWPPPRDATIAVFYLAILGSIIAFWSWLWLLQKLPLMATSTLVFVLPVVALVVDGFWEHELTLAARTYAGIGVVLVGLAISLLTRSRRSPRI